MKFSEKWLREWINIKIDSDVLYNQISNSGIEVESVKKFNPNFSGVIVGQIIKCATHSKFKTVKVIKVDIGNKILNIVCRAPNCRYGIKVAVAIVGAILPKNTIIEKKLLYEEISEGMLCSFFELGIYFYSDKIIEFNQETPIGINVNDYLSLKDNIIKISTTSNRPDGLSILGISRNILALNNFKMPALKHPLNIVKTKKKINLDIKSKEVDINYLGRIIENVNVNIDTPFWIQKKLFLSDILPVNIITDIINYILIEIGQPLNVLDADHIEDCIIIRMSNSKESILLKNNIQLNLDEKILVFSDKDKILSIPGNFNSNTVDINIHTKNIFLSSYLIDKESISYIIKKINSNRILEYHNYGVDSSLQVYAIEYATHLILKICGGIPGPISKIKNTNINFSLLNNSIRLNHDTLNKVTGFFIDANIVSNILYNLNYQVIFKKKYWDVIPPSWRFDILIEEDVIGDVLRIYGYNNIVLNPLQESFILRNDNQLIDLLLEKTDVILSNKGYYEIITYGFIDPKIHDILCSNQKKLLIENPISKDMSCMRSSLLPGLLKTISYNKNRQQKNMRFFEKGLCFLLDEQQYLGVKQEIFLAAAISGNYIKESWCFKQRKVDFYDLKGDLECMLESICELDHIEFKKTTISGLHPEQTASIYFQGNFIGSIGAIDPRLKKQLNVNSSTFLFEISLNHFLNKVPLKIKEISKFPTSRRDISILVSKDITVFDIIDTCKKCFFENIVEVNLFDIYSEETLSEKEKSLGISFIFQDMKKTFEENEINLMMDYCIKVLKEKFQVILRK
ncbi:phenylalanine--tRNA ligase subunit beta [Buchnera aphidicola]|uniref:Phenylalanine--tRNA ligase beta subunit n=1 Tax=Buchnera aphidicola (Lipaphis pseudobrassicae) TaxID=1258543 RepID=A0A4D6Y020_9GAMM|nr:phenylalanine--tRNA ligase subunit beta [Buchnera aphidicola]QCI22013.1 phenylalanine--tRNA ligase subunit beta [Buchnera aphidicola (Lipaphis pseudobrassicae)]